MAIDLYSRTQIYKRLGLNLMRPSGPALLQFVSKAISSARIGIHASQQPYGGLAQSNNARSLVGPLGGILEFGLPLQQNLLKRFNVLWTQRCYPATPIHTNSG